MAISRTVLIVKYHSGNYGQWVTLANITNNDINLSNWRMREYQSATTVGTTWTFPSTTVIRARSLLIVSRVAGSGTIGAPANIPVVQSTLGPFGRTGEKIVLLNPNNQQVDEFIFSTSSRLYSGNTPFQISIPVSLTSKDAFVRRTVTDTDTVADWEKISSSTTIFAWEWAPLQPDIIPPAVVSITPANNATDVAVNAVVKVTFNEPILAGNLLQSITITDINGIPVGSVQASISGSELTIGHAAFENNKTYTVTVPAQAVRDAAGNFNTSQIRWSFRTIADSVPPAKVSTTPADGATNVSVEQDTPVYVEFNEPVLPAAALRSVTIKDENNVPLVYVQAEVALWNNRYLQIFHSRFENNKTYTVNVPAQTVMDAAGNTNASEITWSFTTMGIQQTAAPVANRLTFENTVPEYAKVYGSYGAVEENGVYPVVRIYSSAAKDTLLGTTTATSSGAFWLTFNNSLSLQTVYVTATTPGKTESAVTPLPVSIDDDTELVAVSIQPVPFAEFVPVDATVKVTFNKPILAGPEIGLIYINDHTDPGINYVGGIVNGNELLIPHSTFWNCWYHDVFVPANAVTDTAGNPLGRPLMWTFSTECIPF